MITNNHAGQYVMVRNCTNDAWKKRILRNVVANPNDTDRPYICYGKNGGPYSGDGSVYAWKYAKGVNEADPVQYREVDENDIGEKVEVSKYADFREYAVRRLVAIDDENQRMYVTSSQENNGGWFWRYARVRDTCGC